MQSCSVELHEAKLHYTKVRSRCGRRAAGEAIELKAEVTTGAASARVTRAGTFEAVRGLKRPRKGGVFLWPGLSAPAFRGMRSVGVGLERLHRADDGCVRGAMQAVTACPGQPIARRAK